MSQPLHVLNDIRVASPCHAPWENMVGDDRTRFCGQCEKHVHNLSAMTWDEVEAFVREQEGRACIRFYRRRDGTLLTADCPVGQRAQRRRRAAALAGTVGAAAAMGASLVVGLQSEPAPVMGMIAMPAPPPPVEPAPGAWTMGEMSGPVMGVMAAPAPPEPVVAEAIMGRIALPAPPVAPGTTAATPVSPPGAPPPSRP